MSDDSRDLRREFRDGCVQLARASRYLLAVIDRGFKLPKVCRNSKGQSGEEILRFLKAHLEETEPTATYLASLTTDWGFGDDE